jgi:hypothetical protein
MEWCTGGAVLVLLMVECYDGGDVAGTAANLDLDTSS